MHTSLYNSSDGSLKQFWMGQHLQAAEQLRKWEKEWATIQLSQGKVISKTDHDMELKEMCLGVRNALLNLASKCAPLCAHKNEKQVMTIILKKLWTVCGG